MHELSIATSIAEQVQRHVPALAAVRSVEIRVGALRGLEPSSLEMCWQAVIGGSPLAGSQLVVEQVPWTVTCPTCDRSWASATPFVPCPCGEPSPHPFGTDELDLIAITVDDEEDPAR